MEKLIKYFILFTGGSFVWGHIKKEAIGYYFLYLFVFFGVATIFSFAFSFVFYTIFFLIVFSCILIFAILFFYNEKVRIFILKEGSTIEDAKYTIFLLIYIGVFGTMMSAYILFGGNFIKI